MSKLRQQVQSSDNDLAFEAEGDFAAFVIFTQLKANGPFIYAGWLEAPDSRMAITFAKEHYGQDQKCVHLWAAPRQFVAGMRENAQGASEEVEDPRNYQIFTQAEAGDQHSSSIIVEARSAADALRLARQQVPDAETMHNMWAIPCNEVITTDDDDLIWRYTDQSYRMARGYSKDVRDKWEQVRAVRDVDEYQKEDIKEMF